MASMVAKACSSSSQLSPVITVPVKGSRNKRKFRADPPLTDPHKIITVPQNECMSYEFTAEKFEALKLDLGLSNGCDMCGIKQDASEALKLDLGLSCASGPSDSGQGKSREEIEANEAFHDADWNDLTESELEELVLNNLDANFKSAIKKIVAFGYSEEIAIKAVLRSGLCYGCKDAVSNIVDNTLVFLRSGQDVDAKRQPYFENLQEMEKYILAELVCVLKEVRPFYSTGDAMWCLLICDMNVSLACAMETEPMNSLVGDGIANGTSSTYMPPLPETEAKTADSNFLKPVKPNPSVSSAPICPSETTNTSSVPFGQSFHDAASNGTGVPNLKTKSSFVPSGVPTDKEGPYATPDSVEKFFSLAGTTHLPVSEEKFVGSRKVSGINKREYILRQKSLHLEKHRTYNSKGGSRVGKLSNFGGLVLDKKLKSIADSTAANAKNGFKLGKATGIEVPQDNSNINFSTNIGFPSVPAFKQEPDSAVSSSPQSNIQSSPPAVNTLSMLPAADTELSLSLPAKSSSDQSPVNCSSEAYNAVSMDKTLPQWVPQDKKDEMILNLVSQVREAQNQLQEWTYWANQKVKEAASRLGKDRAELKALRQDKEEVERLKKEKQTLEENTVKKLSEMENALCKGSSQVERANSTVRRLEVENAALRREMEAANLHAADVAANCQEVSRREKTTLLKCQSWEKRKSFIQEELAAYRHKYAELQQELGQAIGLKDQHEGRYALEKRVKEELLTQASSLKKEKEQIEASAKSKEDTMKLKEENNLLKYKLDVQKLEKEISLLRLKTDSSKIAALKRGVEVSYASKLTDSKTTTPAPPAHQRESRTLCFSKMTADLEDYSENGGVKRERECVMCLSEEMSVVFLPCAHQVVCLTCNELHEKQGMKDCPSCRSSIQERICVRYTCSSS